MEFEYWWLLAFPVFMLGWLAAHRYQAHCFPISNFESYFKGRFPVEPAAGQGHRSFTEAAKADTEQSVHFTLGLFRRRGEMDRAIHLHQALVDRPDLGHEQRLLRNSNSARFSCGGLARSRRAHI